MVTSDRCRTRDRAVYSWPCVKHGIVRSRPIRARVRPWQLWKVVAYASCRENCLRRSVWPDGTDAVNVMWGRRISSPKGPVS